MFLLNKDSEKTRIIFVSIQSLYVDKYSDSMNLKRISVLPDLNMKRG